MQGRLHRAVWLLWTLFLLQGSVSRLHAQTFVNPRQVPVSTHPAMILAGDFNNDGRPDLAWNEYSGAGRSQMHILLAQGNGVYLPSATFDLAPSYPGVCRVADTNRDTFLDLVCVGPNGLNVYLGYGNGNFTTVQNRAELFNVTQLSLPLDLNADGIPDFLAYDGTGGRLGPTYVMIGDGRGGFQVTQTLWYGLFGFVTFLNSNVAAVTPVDVDGDGILDIPVDSQTVAFGLGNGTYRLAPYSFGLPGQPLDNIDSCTHGDIDGDGRADEVCIGYKFPPANVAITWQLIARHGNRDGTFGQQLLLNQTYPAPSSTFNQFPAQTGLFALVDVNGDGTPDLLMANNDGLGVMLGRPGPAFDPPLHYAVGSARPLYPGGYVLRDMNGDGILDYVSDSQHAILISYGRPDGSFATAPGYSAGFSVEGGAMADFNEDGNQDVVTTGEHALQLSLGRSDGSFPSHRPIPGGSTDFSNAGSMNGILHGDFNGDHHQDVVAATNRPALAGLYTFFGKGNGSFQLPIANDLPATSLTHAQVVDLNKDGLDDIVFANLYGAVSYSGLLYAALSKGDGTFTTVTSPAALDPVYGAGYGMTPPRVADLEGNGTLDVVYANPHSVFIARGHPNGSFDLPFNTLAVPPYVSSASSYVNGLTLGDFDGDGHIDIAVDVSYLQTTSGPFTQGEDLFIFYGTGAGQFTTAYDALSLAGPGASLTSADLRNEGRPELILTYAGINYGSGDFHLVHTNANRTFDPPQLVTSSQAIALDVADLNHDGLPDLLVTVAGSTLEPLLNLDQPAVTGSLTIAPEPSPLGQPFSLTATLVPPASAPAALSGSITFSIAGSVVGTAPLNANVATLTIPGTYPRGTYAVTATWPGDATYPPLTLSTQHVVGGLSSLTTLTSSLNPSRAGQPVTFTATVADPAHSTTLLTGSVTFTAGTASLSTIPLASFGGIAQASFTTASLPGGTTTITATYAGDPSYAPSAATLIQQVTSAQATATLAAAPSPATVFQTVTLVYTLSGLVPNLLPAGTVSFYDGTILLGTQAVGTSGTASLQATFSTTGSHALSATYAADPNYQAAATSTALQVTPIATTLTLASSLNPSIPGQAVTFTVGLTAAPAAGPYSGPVALYDGSTLLTTLALPATGTATFSTAALALGTHTLTAAFAGTATLGASTSAALTQVVARAPSTITLTASPNPAYFGQTVTLRAVVTSTTTAPPVGSVAFFDGGVRLASAQLAAGIAVFSTTRLAPGTHTLTATYAGELVTAPSTSAPFTEQILGSDFTLAATPPTLSLRTGHHLTFTLQATSGGTFTDQLTVVWDKLPAHAFLRATPTNAPLPAGGTATFSLYLDTDDVIGYLSQANPPAGTLPPRGHTTAATLLALSTLCLTALRRRRPLLRASRALWTLTLLASALLLGSATGCSGLYPASTPPGDYTLRLTVSGQATGVTHTLAVPLTVTP